MAEDIQHVGRVTSFDSLEHVVNSSGGMSSEQITEKALILTNGTPEHVTGAVITDLQSGKQYEIGTVAKRDGSNYSSNLPSLSWHAVLAKLRSLGFSSGDYFGIAVTGKMYP